MNNIENIFYTVLTAIIITLMILLGAYILIGDIKKNPTTETVSIEINKVENTSI